MDQIIKRISEQLANQSSRRGFFSTVGKATLGLATTLAGQGFFTENAAAKDTLQCCQGPACPTNYPIGPCPAGTSTGYVWCCIPPSNKALSNCNNGTNCKDCTGNNNAIACQDCFVTKNGKMMKYICTLPAS